jgi:hypothetical protein
MKTKSLHFSSLHDVILEWYLQVFNGDVTYNAGAVWVKHVLAAPHFVTLRVVAGLEI